MERNTRFALLAALFAAALVLPLSACNSGSEEGGNDHSADEAETGDDAAANGSPAEAEGETVTVTYSIPSLHCDMCTAEIRDQVAGVFPDVELLENNWETKIVVMRMPSSRQPEIEQILYERSRDFTIIEPTADAEGEPAESDTAGDE